MIPKSPLHLLTATLAMGIAFFTEPAQAKTETPEKSRPNILIIYVDDLARGDVGAFGCPDPGTPNIDRIADQGVRLTNAYTNNAPCSPSRTALMMGMYCQRFGKFGLSRGIPIPKDKPTLAETLRDAGYVTGIVGLEKWDIGTWNQGALDRGFMEAAMQPPRSEGREGFGGGPSYLSIDDSYLTETEGVDALDFINRHGKGERPFFLYFVPLAVHIPLTEVPQKYLDRLYPGHEGKYAPRQYLRAALLALDDQIGFILDKLEEMDIAENTLVIFSSDNGGDPHAQHRPLPYRGGKGGANRTNLQWEGNYRMPTIFSFPGKLPAGESYAGMSCTLDFYATAAAVAGVPLPEHCEGKNMLPLLRGEVHPAIREMVFKGTDHQRESAISYFGYGCPGETALTAKPDLVKLLRDNAEAPKLRATAADSLSHLGESAHDVHADILHLLLEEKPNDPLALIDESIGGSLTTLASDPFAAGLVTDKDLFYRAVDKLLSHPRANGRTSGMKLLANMPIEDFHRVGKEVAAVLADQNRSYHSYHNLGPRNGAMTLYANLGIEGGIDAAFAILDEETGKFGFKLRLLMDVLPKYGAAAQPYLPKLREMNIQGRFERPWNSMLHRIENAPSENGKSLTFEDAMKLGAE